MNYYDNDDVQLLGDEFNSSDGDATFVSDADDYVDDGIFDARAVAADSLRRAEAEADTGEDLVREYARKYHMNADGSGPADSSWTYRRQRAEQLAREYVGRGQWKPRTRPRPDLTADERLWSAVAHLSLLLMTGLGILTGSFMLSLLALLLPAGIYFNWRDRSEFVSFNAKQAAALTLVATVGFGVLMTGGVLVLVLGIIVSAIASIVLVGIPFLVLFIILLVLFSLAAPLIPLGLMALSGVAAFMTYSGSEFRYPYIANWVDNRSSRKPKVAAL